MPVFGPPGWMQSINPRFFQRVKVLRLMHGLRARNSLSFKYLVGLASESMSVLNVKDDVENVVAQNAGALERE